MKKVPSVTMKLGSDVFSTRVPLNHPMARANASESGTAMWSPSPAPLMSLASRMAMSAVAPVMAPDDRSNSPPIISSATGTAINPR